MKKISIFLVVLMLFCSFSTISVDAHQNASEHYEELERIGLSAPQVTYIMHELKARGLDVPADVTTIEEATEAILAALKKKGE